jgi:hypothetical protein
MIAASSSSSSSSSHPVAVISDTSCGRAARWCRCLSTTCSRLLLKLSCPLTAAAAVIWLGGAANGCASTAPAAAAARLWTISRSSTSLRLLRLLLLLLLQWRQQRCLLTAGCADSHGCFWLLLCEALLCIIMLLDG